MSDNEVKDIDYVDLGTIVASAIAIASTGTLALGVIGFVLYLAQHKLRRSQTVYEWATRVATHPVAQKVLPDVVPGPKELGSQELTLHQHKPLDVRVVNQNDAYSDLPFWKRATMPLDGGSSASQPVIEGQVTQKPSARVSLDREKIARLQRDIKRLPKYIDYTQLPPAPSKLAVPIGFDAETQSILWADFGNDLDTRIIHALIAGQTGAGKDALLRLWFLFLTHNNTPEDIQFVIIDGKVDWLSPALAESAYMAIPPAGGVDIRKIDGKYVDCAKEQMGDNLAYVFDMITERQNLMTAVGAVDLATYYKKTGKHLPYLFFIASDVGETFNKDLGMLINLMVMKGRAYGVRMILSMQNPVGEDTKWRSQISFIMTGHQANGDHDRYILGMNIDRMLYRPSMIPNPEENDISKGLFIVRRGSSQHLVRTFHLPEDDWFEYIETAMETKHTHSEAVLLESLLFQAIAQDAPITQPVRAAPVVEKSKAAKQVLTEKQIDAVITWATQGANKTEIMNNLRVTNGDRYKEVSPAVDILIRGVRNKMKG